MRFLRLCVSEISAQPKVKKAIINLTGVCVSFVIAG